jgi:uncharacterized protein YjbI with pentapeptide repeats
MSVSAVKTCAQCDELRLGFPGYELTSCWSHTSPAQRTRFLRELQQTTPSSISSGVFRDFDFQGVDLRDVVFEGGDFEGAQFRGALLVNVKFRNAVLTRADFTGAHLDRVKFTAVVADRVDFTRARLRDCSFGIANRELPTKLREANFERATLHRAGFNHVSLEESSFNGAALTDTVFKNCRASDSDFRNIRADRVRFETDRNWSKSFSFERCLFTDAVFAVSGDDSLFTSVDFSGSEFKRVVITVSGAPAQERRISAFVDCTLTNCDYGSGHLDGCVISGGDATSTSFEEAGLKGARFCDVVLTAAAFSAAYLEGTQFIGSAAKPLQMDGTRFENAVLKDVTLFCLRAKAAVFTAAYFKDGLIRRCNFETATFPQAYFERTILDRVIFADASLQGVFFDDCKWKGKIKFKDALLSGSTFTGIDRSDGGRLYFNGANLSDTDLRNVDLHECRFVRAVMDGADFAGANLDGACFDDARLTLCDLSNLTVTRARFIGARLLDCQMHGSRFVACKFIRADLGGSSVVPQKDVEARLGARWRERTAASFAGCDFTAAQLSNCILIGAEFDRAILQRAALRAADLRGASLVGVRAESADFSFAFIGSGLGRRTRLNHLKARGAGFQGADMRRCDCTGADFAEARLDDADLRYTKLRCCRFDWAHMDGAKLDHARLSSAKFPGAHLVGVSGFNRIDLDPAPVGVAVEPPDFSFAYIQATQAPLIGDAKWLAFKNWINEGWTDQDDQRRHLSWVAWKNNYQSLGLYNEQSDCFREEQIARGWDPPNSGASPARSSCWRRPHRWHAAAHAAAFGVALLVVLAFSGLAYKLAVTTLPSEACAFWIATSLTPVAGMLLARFAKGPKAARARLLLLDILFGFGEQPGKVLLNGIFAALAFALLYWFGGVLDCGRFNEGRWLSTPGEYLYFSIVTLTTVGYGEITPEGFCRFLSNCESVVGLIMAALFIFALARRTAGR